MSSLFCAVEEIKGTEWSKGHKRCFESVRLYLERGTLCLKNCMKKFKALCTGVEKNTTFSDGSYRIGSKRE